MLREYQLQKGCPVARCHRKEKRNNMLKEEAQVHEINKFHTYSNEFS